MPHLLVLRPPAGAGFVVAGSRQAGACGWASSGALSTGSSLIRASLHPYRGSLVRISPIPADLARSRSYATAVFACPLAEVAEVARLWPRAGSVQTLASSATDISNRPRHITRRSLLDFLHDADYPSHQGAKFPVKGAFVNSLTICHQTNVRVWGPRLLSAMTYKTRFQEWEVHVMSRYHLIWVTLVLVLLVASHATAACPCSASCCACAANCGEVQYVERTVYEPQWVTETRKVVACEYKQEQRQCTRTVYHCVRETKQVERRCTVMVSETRVRKVPYSVCKPVIKEVTRQFTVCVPEWKEVERQYTVMVPHQEIRQGVRRVCRMFDEQVTSTVTVDRGHWETRTFEVPSGCCCRRAHCRRVCCCDPCGPCLKPCTHTVCRPVWVPNLVAEQVTHTVCRPRVVEEPCQYTVTVCKPETRTCTVRVCEMRQEVRSERCQVTTYETSMIEKDVAYTVCVPKEKTWIETVTTYKQVPQEVTDTYTVCVPHQVEKEVPIQVCRLVPKTVKVPVCSCSCVVCCP